MTTTNDPWAGISASTGRYVKWDEPGKQIVGTVTSKTVGTDLQGNPCPELGIRDDHDEDHTVSASQAQLKNALIEAAPQIGDRISIKYVGDEKRDGGKTLKKFEVKTKPAPAAPAAPAVEEDDIF